MPLSLYLDDCADDDILAALLRRAGHRVSTPRTAGASGVSDSDHLEYAARCKHTLLTKDPDDFVDLHYQWQTIGHHFSRLNIIRRRIDHAWN